MRRRLLVRDPGLRRLFLPAAFAMAFASCGSGDIAVVVRDEDRRPVANVEVREAGSGRLLGTTAADGRARFALKRSGREMPRIRLSRAPGSDGGERFQFDDTYSLRPENLKGTPRLIYVWHEGAAADSAIETPVTEALAALAVTSDPPGGEVLLDGRPTGQRTPARIGDLLPGRTVRLEVRREGYRPHTEERILLSGENAVHASLAEDKRQGEKTYLVSAAPFAEIYLDGRPEVLNPGGAPVSVSLREGRHTFRLVNAAAAVDVKLVYDVRADDANNVLILNWEEKLVKPKRSAQRLPGSR